MSGISYVVRCGPALLTNLIALRMRSLPDGGCAVMVRNVGDRFALDVRLDTDVGMGFIGGLGAGKDTLLELDAVPESPSSMTLRWNDADGRVRVVPVSFSWAGGRWRRERFAER